MKGWKIALWAGIIAAALALLGVWGFAWYYFIFLGKGRDTGGGGFAVYEEALLEPGKTISLFLDQSDFLVNEPEEANLTILCGQEITGEVTVTDEQGNVVCQVENNGSGRLSASVPIAESEARIGGFTAEADGEKSNTASFYVLPEVTEEMFLRLDGVAKDLEDFLLDEEFKDPYGKEAFERITEHLEKDERVAVVAENNQVILFQTVDNLMGSYGMGRKEGLTFGSGFSDKDEVYEKWRRQQDVRGDMIDSGIPITNDKIYHYSPYDTDEIISSSYQAFVEREKRLADKLGMEQLSFVGSEARKWMKEKDRNGNGGSLQMAMETSMERTIRAMLNDLLKDESAEERRESWEFLQSEMQNNPMRYTASGVKRQRIFEGRTVLEGFVVDPEGEGIQGAKVTAHHWLNHRFEEEESATTDSDGKYTLKVPRGIYGITAEKAMGSNGVKMKGHATVQAGKEGEDAGGSSGIADSLLTYSDAQNYTKQVLWADSEYLRYNGGAALAGSNWANRMDGIKTGFSLLGLPEPAIGTDYDGYGDGGGQYPTYWRENYLEKTFRYRCAGTGSYMRRDMQVIVSDESRLKEHIEALGGK